MNRDAFAGQSARVTAETGARVHHHKSQQGLTMVELLVAMVISAVIVLAAVSSLIVSRQGFTAVDSSAQLRDNARFASDNLQRFAVQAGFSDVAWATTARTPDALASLPPSVFGFNNATLSTSNPIASTARSNTATLGFGSDVLVLRYQVAAKATGASIADNSMIDCFGEPQTVVATTRDETYANILHIDLDDAGEPSLMCSTSNKTNRQPLVRGVESFQVLYGVDGVTANTALLATSVAQSVATSFLRADQMTVATDPTGALTNANWRRVRSIRIGMVLRGPVGSAQESLARTYYPLGIAAGSATGAAGSAMTTSTDSGAAYTPAADTRLRQVVTLTIQLRNEPS